MDTQKITIGLPDGGEPSLWDTEVPEMFYSVLFLLWDLEPCQASWRCIGYGVREEKGAKNDSKVVWPPKLRLCQLLN